MQTTRMPAETGLAGERRAESAVRTAFRYDINGLRAWAVLPVVLFHFGIPGFSGGFAGVDVFFVISGFLMTGIVVAALERGRFSLVDFYLSRAVRIVPPLIALCVVLLGVGWFWLVHVDYRELSLNAASALTFVSNVLFWRRSGYFDSASHEKWLLHTWSLSVEWQFYLLLPLAAAFAWRWRRRAGVIALLSAAGVASLSWSIYATWRWPDAAFYLLPSRAWEMLAGGMVWLYAGQRKLPAALTRVLEGVGLALIALAVVRFDSSLSWPGGSAIVPVLGAALVIAASRQRSMFTGNGIVQWLGTRSYSLYLWHWPVAVLLVYSDRLHDPMSIAGGIVAAVLLGEASYQLIERPTRAYLARATKPARLLYLGTAMVGVTLVAIGARYQHVPNRVPELWDMAANEQLDFSPMRDQCLASSGGKSPACTFGSGPLRAIVLGDSHADAMVSAVQKALPNGSIMELSYSGCPTIYGEHAVPGSRDADEQCANFNAWALRKLASIDSAIPVLIVNRTSDYALGPIDGSALSHHPLVYFSRPYDSPTPAFLAEYAQHLVASACLIAKSHPVYLVQPVPEMPFEVPQAVSRQLMFKRGTNDLSIPLDDYDRRNHVVRMAQEAAASQCGIKLLDPKPRLCDHGRCWASQQLRPLYYDADHLSEFGNKRLVPMFREAFAQSIATR
ncbi:acyltransferase family protein [Caballeronia sp. GAFFF2]|uniref:acyltransferase family protein n=1 Tax=Caballeronia sp. GAFFF2 TaxID=2921741 RepID=UPI0020284A29|nr:acyltransferase family protein [Caballeronia sp. GAFFF2]